MMKKIWWILAAVLLCAVLTVSGCAEEPAQETAEWTVLFYFCGSDLESAHSYASYNLQEITGCVSYKTRGGMLTFEDGQIPKEDVQVVVETGGSREWHAQKLGMDIKTDRLQRWAFRPDGNLLEARRSSFELVDEVPLANMADPGTLTDFIRWGVEKYPAKKYCLVLWDHGMGAVNGLIIDELFDADKLTLPELKTALSDSGVHFETMVFDACLMANLETAYTVKDFANWMVGSEELVAGKGSAMGEWLQLLYCNPQYDGKRLGRWICEMTQVKYADEASERMEDTLTWSVIDLSKIERLAATFDRFFENSGEIYVNHSDYMKYFSNVMNEAFEFGLGDARMIDLGRLPYHPYNIIMLKEDVYTELLDAVTEAVVFNTHGPDRAQAFGISFCYAARLTPGQLEMYAEVCPSSHYLALMDAINPGWTAPEWVYEKAERLPEITDLPQYQIKFKTGFSADGLPEFTVTEGTANIWTTYVALSMLNEKTGHIVYLGQTIAGRVDDEEKQQITFTLDGFFPVWPTLEDIHCAVQLIDTDYQNKVLYNIPVRVGDKNYQLRVGVQDLTSDSTPVIYGLWEGTNSDSGVYGRNVIPLSKVSGQDFSLLYPIERENPEDPQQYESSEVMTMYRSLFLSSKPLKAGTYYIDFYVEDLFMRYLQVGRVEFTWDGSKITVKDGTWEGEDVLEVV